MPAAVHAQSAPTGLRGKSVIVSWIEDRSLRAVGEATFRQNRATFSRSIYISTEGRPFVRTTVTPGRRTGSAEAVGEGGRSFAGGALEVRFQGRILIMTTTMTAGGARRLTVEFADGFDSCTARVVTAKETGAKVIRGKSLVTGRPMEVQSVTASGATCTVRSGNVFAN
jgi:hypothetical protein